MCFCFKQKTAYEMRISDWSSDVCSSDLFQRAPFRCGEAAHQGQLDVLLRLQAKHQAIGCGFFAGGLLENPVRGVAKGDHHFRAAIGHALAGAGDVERRSEEHTSELQSLMRISYAVFCLHNKTNVASAHTPRCTAK